MGPPTRQSVALPKFPSTLCPLYPLNDGLIRHELLDRVDWHIAENSCSGRPEFLVESTEALLMAPW